VPGLGGKVTTPKEPIPGQGWYAVVADSEDSEIGLYENLPAE
jgi:predicted enzyme related to lactoylglutathione lyase